MNESSDRISASNTERNQMTLVDYSKIRYFYLRNRKHFPVACVASAPVTFRGQSYLAFAVSTHNPKDTYDKYYGRVQARIRLLQSQVMVVPAGVGARAKITQRIAENEHLPIRTREAAKYWLWWKAHENISSCSYDVPAGYTITGIAPYPTKPVVGAVGEYRHKDGRGYSYLYSFCANDDLEGHAV